MSVPANIQDPVERATSLALNDQIFSALTDSASMRRDNAEKTADEIKEIFFQECEEQLAELESGLLALNDGDTDIETVNAVFRAVHSIKGGAGAFGLDDLVGFAHVFETTLDCVRSQTLEPTQDVLKVMLRSADVLADLTAAAREGGSVDAERTAVLAKELEALAKGEAPPAAPAAAAPEAPAPAAPEPVAVAPEPEPAPAPEPTDESGFQPVPFSFDDVHRHSCDEHHHDPGLHHRVATLYHL